MSEVSSTASMVFACSLCASPAAGQSVHWFWLSSVRGCALWNRLRRLVRELFVGTNAPRCWYSTVFEVFKDDSRHRRVVTNQLARLFHSFTDRQCSGSDPVKTQPVRSEGVFVGCSHVASERPGLSLRPPVLTLPTLHRPHSFSPRPPLSAPFPLLCTR